MRTIHIRKQSQLRSTSKLCWNQNVDMYDSNKTQIAISHPSDRNLKRRLARQKTRGEVFEPLKGYFVRSDRWNAMSKSTRGLSIIYALAIAHPNWPLMCISAAAVFGVLVPYRRLYEKIHFATDLHTTTHARKNTPSYFHYIANSRPAESHELVSRGKIDMSISEDPQSLATTYKPINEVVGICNGILVTSPMQTIFDCLRMLPFDYALPICDVLSRLFSISYEEILGFCSKRRNHWRVSLVRYRCKFIDPKSENFAESLARARMISAGFVVPKLQVEFRNPFAHLHPKNSSTFQTSHVLRTDFVWNQQDKSSGMPLIIAELDGRGKYCDPTMLKSQNASDGVDVLLRQHDRENALLLLGAVIIRFQSSESFYNRGKAMLSKLGIAGVPKVRRSEQSKRARLLLPQLGHRILHKLLRVGI